MRTEFRNVAEVLEDELDFTIDKMENLYEELLQTIRDESLTNDERHMCMVLGSVESNLKRMKKLLEDERKNESDNM